MLDDKDLNQFKKVQNLHNNITHKIDPEKLHSIKSYYESSKCFEHWIAYHAAAKLGGFKFGEVNFDSPNSEQLKYLGYAAEIINNSSFQMSAYSFDERTKLFLIKNEIESLKKNVFIQEKRVKQRIEELFGTFTSEFSAIKPVKAVTQVGSTLVGLSESQNNSPSDNRSNELHDGLSFQTLKEFFTENETLNDLLNSKYLDDIHTCLNKESQERWGKLLHANNLTTSKEKDETIEGLKEASSTLGETTVQLKTVVIEAVKLLENNDQKKEAISLDDGKHTVVGSNDKESPKQEQLINNISEYALAASQVIMAWRAANLSKTEFKSKISNISNSAKLFNETYGLELSQLYEKTKTIKDPNILKNQIVAMALKNTCMDVALKEVQLEHLKRYKEKIDSLIKFREKLNPQFKKQSDKYIKKIKHLARKAKGIKFNTSYQTISSVAMMTASFAGPIGKLALGGVGCIAGLIGMSKQKKAQKKSDKAQKRINKQQNNANYLQSLMRGNIQSTQDLHQEMEGIVQILLQEESPEQARVLIKQIIEKEKKDSRKLEETKRKLEGKLKHAHGKKRASLKVSRADLIDALAKVNQSIIDHEYQDKVLEVNEFNNEVKSLNCDEALEKIKAFKNKEENKNNLKLQKQLEQMELGVKLESINQELIFAMESENHDKALSNIASEIAKLKASKDVEAEIEKKYKDEYIKYAEEAKNANSEEEKNQYSKLAKDQLEKKKIASVNVNSLEALLIHAENVRKSIVYNEICEQYDGLGESRENPFALTPKEERQALVRDYFNSLENSFYAKYNDYYQAVNQFNHDVKELFHALQKVIPADFKFRKIEIGKYVYQAAQWSDLITSLSALYLSGDRYYRLTYKHEFLKLLERANGSYIGAFQKTIEDGGTSLFISKFASPTFAVLIGGLYAISAIKVLLFGATDSQTVTLLKQAHQSLASIEQSNDQNHHELTDLLNKITEHTKQLRGEVDHLSSSIARTNSICHAILTSHEQQNRVSLLRDIQKFSKGVNKDLADIHHLGGHFSTYLHLTTRTPHDEVVKILDWLKLKMQSSVSADKNNGVFLQELDNEVYTYLASNPEISIGALAKNLKYTNQKSLPNALLVAEIMHVLHRIVHIKPNLRTNNGEFKQVVDIALDTVNQLLAFKQHVKTSATLLKLIRKINALQKSAKKEVENKSICYYQERSDRINKLKQRDKEARGSYLAEFERYYASTRTPILAGSGKYTYSLMLTSNYGESAYVMPTYGLSILSRFLLLLGNHKVKSDTLIFNNDVHHPTYDRRQHSLFGFCAETIYRNQAVFAGNIETYFSNKHNAPLFVSALKYDTSGEYKHASIAKLTWSSVAEESLSARINPLKIREYVFNKFQSMKNAEVTFFKSKNQEVTCKLINLTEVQYPFDKADQFNDRKPVPDTRMEAKNIETYNLSVSNTFNQYLQLLRGEKIKGDKHFNFDLSKDCILLPRDQHQLLPLIFPHELIMHISELPQVNKLKDWENDKLGYVRLVYHFEKDQLNLIYQFISCMDEGGEVVNDCLTIPIATFNRQTVQAYQHVYYDESAKEVRTQLCLNEFLLAVLYGSSNNLVGLPGNKTVSIASDEVVFPVEWPFVGLYHIHQKYPDYRFNFDSAEFTPAVSASFEKLISSNSPQHELQSLSAFLTEGFKVKETLNYEVMVKFNSFFKDCRNTVIMAKLHEGTSHFSNLKNDLTKYYFTLLGVVRLMVQIDVEEAASLISEHFEIFYNKELPLKSANLFQILNVHPSSLNDEQLKIRVAKFLAKLNEYRPNQVFKSLEAAAESVQQSLNKQTERSASKDESVHPDFWHPRDVKIKHFKPQHLVQSRHILTHENFHDLLIERLHALNDEADSAPLEDVFKKSPSYLPLSPDKQRNGVGGIINFNFALKCQTSSWFFNCALNCLAHFLFHKLENGELQNLYANDPQYQALLESFQEYYDLPTKPNWDEIYTLLSGFRAPTDKEAIFGPVLRKHLSKILMQNIEFLWHYEGCAIFTDFKNNEVKDIAIPCYKANTKEMDSIREKYCDELNHDNYMEEAKAFWHKEGARNYFEHLGTLSTFSMVSIDHLTLFANTLQIGLEVYTPASIKAAKAEESIGMQTHGMNGIPEKIYPWKLKLYNEGDHWEYEEPTQTKQVVNEHNRYYDNPELPRVFQIFDEDESKLTTIRRIVKESMLPRRSKHTA